MGSARRYEYTVVGDPVNEAARLTELAKSHTGRIVVSERTVAAAGTACNGWRPGECVQQHTKRVRLPTGKEVEVKIPAGLTDGQQIRLKGQGLAVPGGPAGDVLITVGIAPHPYFRPEGANLRLDLIRSVFPPPKGIRLVGVTLSNFQSQSGSEAAELPLS